MTVTATSYRDAAPRVWPDHAGRAAPDAVYFVPPDPAIGEVRSAWSNQTKHGYRRPATKQLVMITVGILLVGGMLAGGLGAAATWILAQLDVVVAGWIPYAAAGAIAALLIAYLAKPRPKCSYVGDDGVALHLRTGFGAQDRVLRFADATSLTVAETEHYTNGAYERTEFMFKWRDADGRVLLELGGMRHDRGIWAQRENSGWELAQAAEARWNELRWARAQDEQRSTGEACFHAKDVLFGVAPERLRIAQRGGDDLLTPDDVQSISIEEGLLVIRRRGAKEGIFTSKNVDRFLVRDVEDLPVLLRALRKIGGFSAPAG